MLNYFSRLRGHKQNKSLPCVCGIRLPARETALSFDCLSQFLSKQTFCSCQHEHHLLFLNKHCPSFLSSRWATLSPKFHYTDWGFDSVILSTTWVSSWISPKLGSLTHCPICDLWFGPAWQQTQKMLSAYFLKPLNLLCLYWVS